MSERILVFLAIVLLLKELGVLQAIKRFFNEVNEETKKDEESTDEVEETIEDDESFNEEEEDNETIEENTGSEEIDESEDSIGFEADADVEEASEERFEDNECSDKEPGKKIKPSDTLNNSSDKPEKEEPKKRTTFFDYIHADPEIVPRAFMKKKCVIPQPDPNKKKDDHVIMFDFKPMGRKTIKPFNIMPEVMEFMRDDNPAIQGKRRVVKNEYPRVTFIDKNTAKLEESPNDVFYCTTKDMSKIRMMSVKDQVEQLRMKKKHMDLLQLDDEDFIIDPFLL